MAGVGQEVINTFATGPRVKKLCACLEWMWTGVGQAEARRESRQIDGSLNTIAAVRLLFPVVN